MDFCEQNKYSSVYLWTFQGLGSARHLYEKFGFTLTQEKTGKQQGAEVTEQRFDAGKGSHRNFFHSSGTKITISGKLGSDALKYQEKEVKLKIAEVKK